MAMPENKSTRAEWYNKLAEIPQNEATKIKITAKAKGQLADGFTKRDAGTDKTGKHLQMKSTRDSVGGRWPGPKGRVGTVLHGKASPSSAESFLHTAKNRETQAK